MFKWSEERRCFGRNKHVILLSRLFRCLVLFVSTNHDQGLQGNITSYGQASPHVLNGCMSTCHVAWWCELVVVVVVVPHHKTIAMNTSIWPPSTKPLPVVASIPVRQRIQCTPWARLIIGLTFHTRPLCGLAGLACVGPLATLVDDD